MTVLDATGISVMTSGHVLLDTVDLRARSGECVAVRGANGSGKTTLLRVLCGLLVPTTGHVHLDDEPLNERRDDHRSKLAALVGSPAVYPDMTVVEHLELICASWRIAAEAAGDRVDSILSELELIGLRDRFATELSSGQRQLFDLAQVLVRPFSVLMIDEPEQRLDAHRLGLVAGAIRRVRDAGAAVIIATHSDELMSAVSTRGLSLDDAR